MDWWPARRESGFGMPGMLKHRELKIGQVRHIAVARIYC